MRAFLSADFIQIILQKMFHKILVQYGFPI